MLLRCVARFCELRGFVAAAAAATEMDADLVCGTSEGLLGFVKLFGDFEKLTLCIC